MIVDIEEQSLAEVGHWPWARDRLGTPPLAGLDERDLRRVNPKKYLYELYRERVASLRSQPPDSVWDGTSRFETK